MKKYDSIPRYGKQGTRDILGTEVVIMEKLDGANASFGIIDGKLKMFSRNQELNEHNTLRGFYDWVKQNIKPGSVFVNTIYFGEWLVPHTVQYKKEARSKFYLFDIYDVKTDTYLDWNITVQAAKHLGLRTPEVFFRGELHSMTDVDKYIGQSELTEIPNTGEGIVVKDYIGQQFVKIVSDKFKETKSIKQPSLNKSDIDSVVDSVLTTQRVEKLIHKKIDLGLLPTELDITDTGNVLKTLSSDVVNDIFEEEMHIFLDMLRKKISKKTPIAVRELLEQWENAEQEEELQ